MTRYVPTEAEVAQFEILKQLELLEEALEALDHQFGEISWPALTVLEQLYSEMASNNAREWERLPEYKAGHLMGPGLDIALSTT